jgi:hypothetical protein
MRTHIAVAELEDALAGFARSLKDARMLTYADVC